MVALRVLARTKLAGSSRHSSLNSRPFNLLQPLVKLQKSQLLYNQANPASFCKTPGVGVHLRDVGHCNEAQKCLSVTPLLATLTHSVSRKSFPCHSYENTWDGVPNASPPSFASAVICTTWRLYPLWPQWIAHTSRHHGGVGAPPFSVSSVSLWRTCFRREEGA